VIATQVKGQGVLDGDDLVEHPAEAGPSTSLGCTANPRMRRVHWSMTTMTQ
jgi:hypothetical protein